MNRDRFQHCLVVSSLMLAFVFLHGCAPGTATTEPDERIQSASISETDPVSAAERYAAEVLAYMIQVTLGKAGNPKLRDAWGRRGLELPLDFEAISQLMTGPERRPARVMVLDNNILGLSQVLYHYDRRLNLFKGRRSQDSLFPSMELIGLRVMLLQKMFRGEKVNMSALMELKPQILDSQIPAEAVALKNTGLTLAEMKLLKDVIRSDPSFMAYLENPFIVETLYRVGVAHMDAYVRSKIQDANYDDGTQNALEPTAGDPVVTVSIVPSFLGEYEPADLGIGRYPDGLKPDEDYNQAVENLKATLRHFLEKLIGAQMAANDAGRDGAGTAHRDRRVRDFMQANVRLVHLNQRPLAVYPENADRVLRHVGADFNIIVLGKNVYLALHISDVDTFPHVKRLYLDLADVKHAQVDYELSQISMFVFNKLKDRIQ